MADDFVVSFLPYDGIWTYYTRENGNIILKGPYQENSELYQQLITRSAILRIWQTPYILHPIDITKDDQSMIWLQFPNAIGHFPSRYHLHQKQNDQYYLSDELIDTLHTINNKNRKHHNYDLLKAYVHLYIINSGSHTPFTTLIDHQNQIVIPEYTGYSNPVSDTIFYLNQGDYNEKHNNERYELFKPYYRKLADELELLEVDIGYKLRKEKAIELLRKHS